MKPKNKIFTVSLQAFIKDVDITTFVFDALIFHITELDVLIVIATEDLLKVCKSDI